MTRVRSPASRRRRHRETVFSGAAEIVLEAIRRSLLVYLSLLLQAGGAMAQATVSDPPAVTSMIDQESRRRPPQTRRSWRWESVCSATDVCLAMANSPARPVTNSDSTVPAPGEERWPTTDQLLRSIR